MEAELLQTFQSEIEALKQHHTKVARDIAVSVAIFVFLGTLTGAFYLRSYHKDLAKAEAVEQSYRQDKQTFEKQIDADRTLITELSKKQQVVVKVIHDRDQATVIKTQEVQKATPAQVIAQAPAILNAAPTPDFGKLCFTPDEVKTFEVTKLDRDRLAADYADQGKILQSEQEKSETLQGDLQLETQERLDAEQALVAYKKVAKKSGFKKFLGGAKDVGLVVLGGLVVRLLTK